MNMIQVCSTNTRPKQISKRSKASVNWQITLQAPAHICMPLEEFCCIHMKTESQKEWHYGTMMHIKKQNFIKKNCIMHCSNQSSFARMEYGLVTAKCVSEKFKCTWYQNIFRMGILCSVSSLRILPICLTSFAL